MFVKLQEKMIGNGHPIAQLSNETLTGDYAWNTTRNLLHDVKASTLKAAKRSEKSISIISNTLNRIFNQGLLNKFHFEEMRSVVIITKNLSEEIKHCIQYENYLYDINVLHINELPQMDLKIDMIIAFDFNFETIFFKELSELTKAISKPFLQFGMTEDSLFMGPIFFT